jgi:hypothetical protein
VYDISIAIYRKNEYILEVKYGILVLVGVERINL